MEVRRAKADDAQAIAEVHVATWQGAYRGLLPDAYLAGLSVERRAHWWSRALADPEIDIFVGSNETGSVVGFASLQGSRDADDLEETGELTTIYVMPEAWGRGLGRALMEAILDRARQRGFRCVTLWVLDANQRARRFYEKLGFSTDGAEKTETPTEGVVLLEVRYRLDLQTSG